MRASEQQFHLGDVVDVLDTLPERHYQCVVTSPPYWGLRDYGTGSVLEIGSEPTLVEFIDRLVHVFRGVHRVLRDDGVLWVNLGDAYAGGGRGGYVGNKSGLQGGTANQDQSRVARATTASRRRDKTPIPRSDQRVPGLKPKDLMLQPWRVALALQADGWWLRDAVIWHKPNPMPGSQRDRCTSAYEVVFQLTKSPRYFFDLDAESEPATSDKPAGNGFKRSQSLSRLNADGSARGSDEKWNEIGGTRFPRNVWTIPSEPLRDKHYAAFPTALVAKCLRLATSEHGACPVCSAPWKRIVEKHTHYDSGSGRSGHAIIGKQGPIQGGGDTQDLRRGPVVTRVTRGWRPTCVCDGVADQLRIPCRVLDPFMGSGSTALTARRLGLDCDGIELNPDYVAIAKKRLRREANRGADVPAADKQHNAQRELF